MGHYSSRTFKTYETMDKENAGSGFRLWISRNGIDEPYRPHAIANKGPAIYDANGTVGWQEGYEGMKASR